MKHTPGPWVIAWAGNGQTNRHYMVLRPYSITIDSENRIASIGGGSEHTEADATLIAAAPDMLAALKELVAETIRCDNYYQQGVSEGSPVMDKARAAIAKAQGE